LPVLNDPQSPTPIELSVGDIRWQIVAEWLEIAQWSQWRAYRKTTSLFPTLWSTTPNDRDPLPWKWGSQMHHRICRISKARRTWWNKTEIKQNCRRSAVSFQLTVDSFVLF